MQPNPAPPPAPIPNNSNNQYDFILNGGQPQKNGMFNKLSSGSKATRIAIFAGGLFILLIFVIMFLSIIGGSNKSQVEGIIGLAQEQSEIIRVAGIGYQKANSSDTKNLAITTQQTIQTAQNQTIALLKSSGHKLNDKQLALKNNSKTDSTLDDAANNNSFDEEFTKLIKDQLQNYRLHLQSLYKTSTNSGEKSLLDEQFNAATTILTDKQD